VLELLAREAVSEEEVETALVAALADPDHAKPSVETFLHALCLDRGARWVAHTHAVSVNRILCSRLGAEPFLKHLFPDAIVVCGPVPAVVPYADPGFALAKAVQAELARFGAQHGAPPKLLLLVNHGLVALGESAREALNITLMADKWARILWGTYALGGPCFLPDEEVAHIDARLDEAYRRRRLREVG
jgi:rhamnose utilization protein RhaD (predicted bifunctional aldolase and dehydrogenase)